ncbi:MAG: efflux RND transporter periplasmic adaptor subunit [Acidobacteriota bacterium]|nr:efflux RND transporter periplasmic adaptor subunit [Acidobacteriota bacterium]
MLVFRPSLVVMFATALAVSACNADATRGTAAADTAAVSVSAVTVSEQPITRFIRVSGTLMAQEDAEVAAEVAGRVVATPVERGSLVRSNDDLIRIASADADAQAREAQANAAQIEARLGLEGGGAFDVERVPEVANAKANRQLAQNDFSRAKRLYDDKLLSQSEFDQRSMQVEAAERQYDVAKNGAAQQYQALMGARARVAMAQKALADTVVRAPFAGAIGERFVSVGDYVTKGTKVASVLRIDPLRVELTVPEQYVSAVAVGRAVTFEVDAYPGETFTGAVRYVSPSVTAATRALTLEAIVPNTAGRLKPGFFATARIEEAQKRPGILVPAAAVRTVAGTARVFVIAAGRAEERIVMTGQVVGDQIEIATGLKGGERVATAGLDQLVDGVAVAVK